jgi:hypothetical protein
MTIPIYLMGYGGHAPARLSTIVEQLGAVVFDIRLSPTSQDERWRGEALSELLGERYIGNPAWGNKNRFNGGKIEIMDWKVGLQRFKLYCGDRRPAAAILLCGCRSITECHRAVVGRRLAVEERYEVRDLHHWTKPEAAQLLPVAQEFATQKPAFLYRAGRCRKCGVKLGEGTCERCQEALQELTRVREAMLERMGTGK